MAAMTVVIGSVPKTAQTEQAIVVANYTKFTDEKKTPNSRDPAKINKKQMDGKTS